MESFISPERLHRYKTEYIECHPRHHQPAKYSGLRIVMVIEPDSLPNLITKPEFPESRGGKHDGAMCRACSMPSARYAR